MCQSLCYLSISAFLFCLFLFVSYLFTCLLGKKLSVLCYVLFFKMAALASRCFGLIIVQWDMMMCIRMMGGRAFSCQVLLLWNHRPFLVQEGDESSSFRSRLKPSFWSSPSIRGTKILLWFFLRIWIFPSWTMQQRNICGQLTNLWIVSSPRDSLPAAQEGSKRLLIVCPVDLFSPLEESSCLLTLLVNTTLKTCVLTR